MRGFFFVGKCRRKLCFFCYFYSTTKPILVKKLLISFLAFFAFHSAVFAQNDIENFIDDILGYRRKFL